MMLLLALPALGQAPEAVSETPQYQGFQVPRVGGQLTYSLTAAERYIFDYDGLNQDVSYASFEGNAALATSSLSHPFSMVLSAGYMSNNSGRQPSSFFTFADASQQINTGHWSFLGQDTLHYTPESSTGSLSGLAGLGDLGSGATTIGDSVLTGYATRITNLAAVSAERKLTGSTSLKGAGSFQTLRFQDEAKIGAVESNDYTGSAELSHRINALNTIAGNYIFSSLNFLHAGGASFTVQDFNFQYVRVLSRRFSVDVSGGPEYTGGSPILGSKPSWNFSANGRANYVTPRSNISAVYIRSVNNGDGTTFGLRSNYLMGSADRQLGRLVRGSLLVAYGHTAGLQVLSSAPYSTQSVVGTAQISRSLTRTLSTYVSYTATKQNARAGSATFMPWSGLSHTLGFGLTFTPEPKHIGRP